MAPHRTKIDRLDSVFTLLEGLLRLLVLNGVLISIVLGNWYLLMATGGILLLVLLLDWIEHRFKTLFPVELKLFYIVLLIISIFFGEFLGFYGRFHWWDTPLHLFSGAALALVGFLVLFVLHERKRLKVPPMFIAIMSFSFAMMVGVLWEVFEFAADEAFDLTMQPSNHDTMMDLVENGVGAMAVSVMGMRQIKGRNNRFISRMTKKFMLDNPDLFKG